MSTFDRAEHCRRIARDGGLATLRNRGRWHFVTIGIAGKEVTIARHGVGYWKGITQAKGWRAPRQPDLGRDLVAGKTLADLEH